VLFRSDYYRRTLDKTRKKQTKFIAIGFGIPIVISLITDSIIAALGIVFPTLGHISGSFTAFFVLYAMSKYSLFTFRPEFAAENIFSAMPDAIILVNLQGIILKTNPSLTNLCGYTERELLGKTVTEMLQIASVCDQTKQTPKIIGELRFQRELKNIEIMFSTKAGERKSGMVSCSMVTDGNGRGRHLVCAPRHHRTQRNGAEAAESRAVGVDWRVSGDFGT
jgi:PAS domain S-box-containing protein